MCWNQTLTSTNIRSETMNLLNKKWRGECKGRGGKWQQAVQIGKPSGNAAGTDANGKARK